MTKRTSVLFGLLLIFFGAQAFFYRVFLPVFGLETGNGRLWPLVLGNFGLILVLVPFLNQQRRGWGALFIPGLPIVVTSSLLLLASVTHWWGMWAYIWPLIIVSLALGFVITAVWMRNIWFLIPGTIIGVNGLLFLFCAMTNTWEAWAGLWPVEFLAVGGSLLLVNVWAGSKGLFTAGMVLSVMAGFGFALMALLLSGWVSVLAAIVLVGTGVLLIGRNALPELGCGGENGREKAFPDAFTPEDVIRIKEG